MKGVFRLKDSGKLQIDGGLALAMIAGGALASLSSGSLLPLITIGAAVAVSYYLFDKIRLK